MDRRIIHWGLSGLLMTSVAVGATVSAKPANSTRATKKGTATAQASQPIHWISDLKQATRLARMMVTQWGMSPRVGPVFFQGSDEHPFLGREMGEHRDHSEHTAQLIDEEVARFLREADDRAFQLLSDHRDELER